MDDKYNELKLNLFSNEYNQGKEDYKSLDQKISYIIVILVALLTCLSLLWDNVNQNLLLKILYYIQLVIMMVSLILNLWNLKTRKFLILDFDKILDCNLDIEEKLLLSYLKIIKENRNNIRRKGQVFKIGVYVVILQVILLSIFIIIYCNI